MSEITLKAVSIVLKEQISKLRSNIDAALEQINAEQSSKAEKQGQRIDNVHAESKEQMVSMRNDLQERVAEVEKGSNEIIDLTRSDLEIDLEKLESDLHCKIDSNEKSNAAGTEELLTRTEYLGKTLEKLKNNLVDLELYAREGPARTLEQLTKLTEEFDNEIHQRLQAYSDTLDANSNRCSDLSETIESLNTEQKEYQEKTSDDIEKTFVASNEAHKKDIESYVERIHEDLRQLAISHKTEIAGDLLTRLKGEPGDKGEKGDQDPGPTFTDHVWEAAAEYSKRDVLWKDGHSFIALKDNPQGEPGGSKDWAKFTMRGLRGRRGLKGEQGEQGKRGKSGIDGDHGRDAPDDKELAKIIKAMITPVNGLTFKAFRGKWAFDVNFAQGEVVTFGNGAYIAKVQNTGKLPGKAEEWIPIVPSSNGSSSGGLDEEGAFDLVTSMDPLGVVVSKDDTLYIIDSSEGESRKVKVSNLIGGWRDLRAPLLGGRHVGVSDPSLKSFGPTGNVKQFQFDVGDEVMLAFHIDHDIKEGSTVYPHVHWATDGVSTNTTKWELNFTIADRNDITPSAFPAETQILLEAAAAATAWAHQVTEDATGFDAPEVDSLVLMHVKRITNGGTDNTDDVFGLFVDLHYEAQQYGTQSRAPDFYT